MTTSSAFVLLVADGVAAGIVIELADAVALFIAHATLKHRSVASGDRPFSGGVSQTPPRT